MIESEERMNDIKFAKRLLLDKLRRIEQSDNDHWLLREPIHIALESMDKLETTEKELKELREECKNLQLELKAESESVVLLTKELVIYKKALELLCEYLDDSGICVGCGKNCPSDGSKTPCRNVIYETYLLEAREE